jgi:serine/threonine protein kinase
MGTTIDRRYVLVGPIGRGGVSVVYEAVDTTTNDRRAIKVLSSAFANDVRARDRMRREAMVADQLRHPNVPRIYDVGDAPLPDGMMVPYVVMELLTGVVLASRLAGGALPWRDAVSVAATVADVLAVAHRRGIVHRDLSPLNIMLTTAGVKIIDFGLAVLTEEVWVAGSRMAELHPDRVSTEPDPAKPADDVYSLGVLLYQMLTGRSPYPTVGQDDHMAGARFRFVAPTPVLLVPGMPQVVADIVRDCMGKRAADRPDGKSVARALWSVVQPAGNHPAGNHPAGNHPADHHPAGHRAGGHRASGHRAGGDPTAWPGGSGSRA